MILTGLTSSSLNIGFLTLSINPAAGIILGIVVLVLIIAGFLIIKYKRNTARYDEELNYEANQGIVRRNLDI